MNIPCLLCLIFIDLFISSFSLLMLMKVGSSVRLLYFIITITIIIIIIIIVIISLTVTLVSI